MHEACEVSRLHCVASFFYLGKLTNASLILHCMMRCQAQMGVVKIRRALALFDTGALCDRSAYHQMVVTIDAMIPYPRHMLPDLSYQCCLGISAPCVGTDRWPQKMMHHCSRTGRKLFPATIPFPRVRRCFVSARSSWRNLQSVDTLAEEAGILIPFCTTAWKTKAQVKLQGTIFFRDYQSFKSIRSS